MQTGELERLKEFGITKNQIIEHGNKIMADKELVNQKGQIVDQENFNKTLFSLMKERYSGGMELQSKTFKGAMSTMRGEIKNTMATLAGVDIEGNVISGGLLDKLKDGVLGITGVVRSFAKSNVFNVIGNGISKVANIGASVFSGIKSIGVPALNTIKSGINALSPFVLSFMHSLKTGAKQIKGILGVEGVLAFYKIKQACKDAFGVIKIELGKITAAFGKFVANGGMEKIGIVIGKAMEVASKAIAFCCKNMDKIIKISKVVVGSFLAFKSISKVVSVFKTVSFGVMGMIATFKKVQGAIRFVHSAFNLLSPVKLIIMGIVLAGVLLYKNWDKVKEVCKPVTDAIVKGWGKVKECWDSVSEGVSHFCDLAVKRWDEIKTACSNIVDSIVKGWNSVTDCWDKVKTTVGDMVDKALGKWNDMKQACKDVVDDVLQKWQSVKDFFSEPITGTINFVKDKLGFGGDDTGGSKVDGIHKTGLTRVPFDNYTAKLHEGERVLTKQETNLLDQGKLGANNGGSSQPIQINIANMNVREESDINKIANALARIIKNDGLNYA